jgi:hypothetical protein
MFGKGGAALRLTFLDDVGMISAIQRPSLANWYYFWIGLRARCSAYWHYVMFRLGVRGGAIPSEHSITYLAPTDRQAVK